MCGLVILPVSLPLFTCIENITALKCKYFNDYIPKLVLKYPLRNILLITGEFHEEKEQEN